MADASTISISGTPSVPVVGVAYTFTPTVSGGSGTQAWTVKTGTLPAGLNISDTTGEISGTPTAAGDEKVTLSVTDTTGTATLDVDLDVVDEVSITSTSLADAEVGQTYSQTLTTSGGSGTKTWTVSDSTWPAGLSLGSGTGIVTGIPTASGSFDLTFTVTDASGSSTKKLTLKVDAELSVSGNPAQQFVVGTAATYTPTINGGESPYTVTLKSGTIPDGLSLDATTGVISGTATSATGSVSSVVLTFTDSFGATQNLTVDLAVSNGISISGDPDPTTIGDSYSFTPTVTGGSGTQTWTVATGTLPDGLTLNTTTGEVSGTSTKVQNETVTLSVSDTTGTAVLTVPFDVTDVIDISTSTIGALEVGTAVSFSPTINGGTGTQTWSMTGTLPDGLTFGTSDGTISGTPTTAGTESITISVTDSTGTSSATLNLHVYPVIAISGTPTLGVVGTSYTFTPAVTGGDNPTISVAGSLPPGIALDSSGLDLKGTPTKAGTYPVVITATDQTGSKKTLDVTFTVAQPLTISTTSVGDTDVGVAVSDTLAVAGGNGTVTWAVSEGALPDGLTMASGVISGTPTKTGTFNFTITATDNTGTATQAYTVNINAVPALTGPASVLFVTGTSASYSPSISGGTSPYTYSLKSGETLPAGLTLSTTTGTISGTPTATAAAASFEIDVVDAAGLTSSTPVSITVVDEIAITADSSIPEGEIGVAYSFTPAITGGSGTQAWSLTHGTLPAGLTVSDTTGEISGTPTASGTALITLGVSDNSGAATQNFTIEIAGTISVSNTPGSAVVGEAYAYTPTIIGGVEPYTYSLASGSTLPAGVSFDDTTGELSGTPTATGSSEIGIVITDSLAQSYTLSTTITTVEPIAFTGNLPAGEVGVTYSYAPTVTGGSGTQSWSVISGTLPSGLSLSPTTGAITGIPTATLASTQIGLHVTDSSGAATVASALVIYAALDVTGTIPASVSPGSAYDYKPTVTGGSGTYTFSITDGTLPTGLTLDATTGEVSGKPTASGTSQAKWVVSDGVSSYAVPLTFVVAEPIGISYTINSDAEVGQGYSVNPVVTNGAGTQAWTISTGDLPVGLVIDPTSGAISGKPTTAGSTSVTVSVTDTTGTATADITITVDPALGFTFTPGIGYTGSAYTATPTVTGGKSPIQWSLSSSLGHGLSLDTATGILSASDLTNSGTVSGSLTALDANNVSVTNNFTFNIVQKISIGGTPGTIQVGVPFDFTPAVTGGSGTQTWIVSSGSLPTGISLNTATGELTGTPQISAASQFTLQVTDLSGTASSSYILNVTVPLSMTGAANSAYVTGAAFSFQPTVVGGDGTVVFSSSDIPSFLSVNATTGVVSGTLPAVATSVSFTLTATDNITSKSIVVAFSVAAPIGISYSMGSPEVGISTSFSPTVTGGNGAQTWYVSSGTLPDGFALNTSTGVISGTPTTAGTSSITISAKDSISSASTNIVIGVASALQMTIDPANGVIGSAYTASPTISGGVLPYKFTVDTSLGHGLTLSSTKGTVTSPALTGEGTIAAEYTVTDAAGATITVPFSMAIAGPVGLTGSVPQGEVGFAFSFTPTTTDGSGTKTYSITSGTLPAGLTGSPTTGVISGTPTVAGTTPVTLTVEDATGSASIALIITINPAMTVAGSIPNGVVGKAYNFTPIVAGGTPSKTYALSGTLPDGLSFDKSSGTISGTPTTAIEGLSIAVSITDSYTTVQLSNSINIYTPISITGTPVSVFSGDTFSFAPNTAGGNGTKTFAIESGTLPSGFTFDSTTGTIAGTASSVANTDITIEVTDYTGSADLPIVIKVVNHLEISGDAPDALVGQAYTFTPTVTGGTGTYTYSLSGNTPAGFTFDTTTGTLSGTAASAASAVKSTITVTDGQETESLSIDIAVDQPIVIAGTPPVGVNGEAYSFTPTVTGGNGTKTYSYTGALPAGITFDAENDVFSGTPTVDGVFPIVLNVTDSSGSQNGTFNLTIGKSLAIGGTIPAAVMDTAYTYTPTVVGGGATHTFSITGTLPDGITFDTTTGELSGTSTAIGTYPIVITVTDGNESAQLSGDFAVKDPMEISGSIPVGAIGQSYTFTPTVIDGSGARTFALTTGTLPAGLSFDTATGTISGTPTAAGSTAIVISVSDTFATITLTGTLTIANTGTIPGSTVVSNDTQIQVYITQYRAIQAQSTISAADRITAIRLLSLITNDILKAPTQTILQAYWQMHVDFQNTAFVETSVFIDIDLIPGQSQTNLMVVYNAFRSAVTTPKQVTGFSTLLNTTGCTQMVMFLVKKLGLSS